MLGTAIRILNAIISISEIRRGSIPSQNDQAPHKTPKKINLSCHLSCSHLSYSRSFLVVYFLETCPLHQRRRNSLLGEKGFQQWMQVIFVEICSNSPAFEIFSCTGRSEKVNLMGSVREKVRTGRTL